MAVHIADRGPGGDRMEFVIARNPDESSSLPFLVRVPLGADGIALKVRETWPRTSKVYCHRADEWPDDLEVIERVPVRSCVRRGTAIDLVLEGRFGPCPQLPSLEGSLLATMLTERTGASAVELVPDITAAAVGEAELGIGRHSARFMCVTLGTGANAMAVINGIPLTPTLGCLGDAGHVLVDPDGPPCGCGGSGCLEAICSGQALARDGKRFGLPSARLVLEAALAGDEHAVAVVARAGIGLGRAIATWSVLLWPETIAVAGGLSVAGDLLLSPARDEMRRVGPPYVVDQIELVVAELGAEATLAGAAIIARR